MSLKYIIRNGVQLITHGGTFSDKRLGTVTVRVRDDVRQASCRYVPGKASITVPYLMPVSDFKMFLSSCYAHVEAHPQQVVTHHHLGQRLALLFGDIIISQGNDNNFRLKVLSPHDAERLDLEVQVPQGFDFNNPVHDRRLGEVLTKFADSAWESDLYAFADQICETLGVYPHSWCTGRGTKTLGTCSAKTGKITLSRYLYFLSADLIEYVIKHELAHLTYPDHSAAFHELVDQYCGGQEQALEARIRMYDWPIAR